MSPPSSILIELVDLLERELRGLDEARDRRGVDFHGVSARALSALIDGLLGIVESRGSDPSLSESERQRIDELRNFFRRYEARAVQVSTHLAAMTSDWSCAACGARTPKGVYLSGLRSGAAQVEVICRACSARSPVTIQGRAVFDLVFGPLVHPGWNAAANGFTTRDD